MKFIARLGPFHTFLELFENGHFFLRFRRNASPHVAYSQSFSPVHTKTLKRWKFLQNPSQSMRNLRFCLSIRKRKAAGFKKYPFWSAFLVIVFTGSCAQIPTASSQYCRDIWLELKLCWLPPLAVNIILFILKCWESLCRHGLNILSTGFLWMLAEYCDCLIVSFSSWDCLVPERIVRC